MAINTEHHQQHTLQHAGCIHELPFVHSFEDAMSNICTSHMDAFACASKQVINKAHWGNRGTFFQVVWPGYKGSNISNCKSSKGTHRASFENGMQAVLGHLAKVSAKQLSKAASQSTEERQRHRNSGKSGKGKAGQLSLPFKGTASATKASTNAPMR